MSILISLELRHRKCPWLVWSAGPQQSDRQASLGRGREGWGEDSADGHLPRPLGASELAFPWMGGLQGLECPPGDLLESSPHHGVIASAVSHFIFWVIWEFLKARWSHFQSCMDLAQLLWLLFTPNLLWHLRWPGGVTVGRGLEWGETLNTTLQW